MKKLISAVLLAALLFAVVAAPASAEDSAPVYLEEDDTEAVDASLFLEDTEVTRAFGPQHISAVGHLDGKGDRPDYL